MQPEGLRGADVTPLGVDETDGRFGDVSVWRCGRCSAEWLHYEVEYEGISSSGRWFRGLVPNAGAIAPKDAVAALSALDWHIYGGSYFGRTGRSSGKVRP